MAATRSWTIGADPSCDLVVSQDFVSGRHCRLSETPAGYVLEDLGSTNGTFINGTRLAGSRGVSRQDRITLGATTPFPWGAIPAPVAGASSSAAPAAARGARIITIGRGPENDVVLDYATVSTRHARLLIDGGSVTIEDLGSTNGTFLGGLDRRVTTAPLVASDTVYFGTQAIPATRLLAGVALPAGPTATVAVDARMLAGAVAPIAGQPATQVRPAVVVASGSAGGVAPPTIARAGIPPAALGAAVAAAVVVLAGAGWYFLKGGSSTPAAPPGGTTVVPPPGGVIPPGGGRTVVPPGTTSPTPTASDPGRAVYAVLIDSRGDEQRRVLGNIGSAVAISDRRLLTSGGVVTEVRRALAESWDVSVYSPALKRELRVVSATPHPEFDAAVGEFQKAETEFTALREQLAALQKPPADNAPTQPKPADKPPEKPTGVEETPATPATPPKVPTKEELEKILKGLRDLEDRMLQAKEREIHFDVGTIDVDGALPTPIAVAPAEPPLELRAMLRLLAIPADPKNPEVTRGELKPPAEASGRYRQRPPLIETPGVKQQSLLIRSGDDERLRNWSGGAVLDDAGRLTAIFSRPTPPLMPNEAPSALSGEIVPAARWTSLLSGSN